MDTILLKYHHLGNEYLVYDICKNNQELNERAVRTICTRNFGLGAQGILVGPVLDGQNVSMKIYQPDGKETRVDKDAAEIFMQYLEDAGYSTRRPLVLHTEAGDISSGSVQGMETAEAIGKMYLSESFVFGKYRH